VTPAAIVRAVGNYYGIPVDVLRGDRRAPRVIFARHIAAYLCRVDGQCSYPEIGAYLRKDHTTALHAHRRIVALVEADNATVARAVESIRERMATGRQPSAPPQDIARILDGLLSRLDGLRGDVEELRAAMVPQVSP
jgi:hypothetical protein